MIDGQNSPFQVVKDFFQKLFARFSIGQSSWPYDARGNQNSRSNSALDLYQSALQIVLRDRKTSVSYLQRKLKIGYQEAAALIGALENAGIVSHADAAGRREILINESEIHENLSTSKFFGNTLEDKIKSALENPALLACTDLSAYTDEISKIFREISDNAVAVINDLNSDIANASAAVAAKKETRLKGRAEYISKVTGLVKNNDCPTHYEIIQTSDEFISLSNGYLKKIAALRKEFEKYKNKIEIDFNSMHESVLDASCAEYAGLLVAEQIPRQAELFRNGKAFISADKNRLTAVAISSVLAVILILAVTYFSWPLMTHTFNYLATLGVTKTIWFTVGALAFLFVVTWLSSESDSNILKILILLPIVWMLYAFIGPLILIGSCIAAFYSGRELMRPLESLLDRRRGLIMHEVTSASAEVLASVTSLRSGGVAEDVLKTSDYLNAHNKKWEEMREALVRESTACIVQLEALSIDEKLVNNIIKNYSASYRKTVFAQA